MNYQQPMFNFVPDQTAWYVAPSGRYEQSTWNQAPDMYAYQQGGQAYQQGGALASQWSHIPSTPQNVEYAGSPTAASVHRQRTGGNMRQESGVKGKGRGKGRTPKGGIDDRQNLGFSHQAKQSRHSQNLNPSSNYREIRDIARREQNRLFQQEPGSPYAQVRTQSDVEVEYYFYRELKWIHTPDDVPDGYLVALEDFFDRDVHHYHIRDALNSNSAAQVAKHHCHEGPYTLYEIAVALCPGSKITDMLANMACRKLVQEVMQFDNADPTIERLNQLVRCGAYGLYQIQQEWGGETLIHVFCAQCCIKGSADERAATVAAWLIDRWPLALLMQGATHRNGSSFHSLTQSCGPGALILQCGSALHEKWLNVLAQGYAKCLDRYPARMECMLQLPDFRRMLNELESNLQASGSGGDLSRAGCQTALSAAVAEALGQVPAPAWDTAAADALLALRSLSLSAAQASAEISTPWNTAAELHRRRRHAFALRGLVGCCNDLSVPLERVELEARLQEVSTMLENQRAGSRTEIGRLESELAAARRDLAQKEQQVQALRDVAIQPQASGTQAVPQTAGAGPALQSKVEASRSTSPGVGLCGASDVIADLRRQRLVDVGELSDLSPEIVQGVRSMQASLSRAVERLAKDLYASDAHALHELLQNADDCKYAADKEPSLQFLLGKASGTYFFAAESNELGFRDADVRALCDINASTKSSLDSAAIGHKGIGWKSLFLLSDSPHVLSRDYAFKFDIAGPLGLLGYVTPTWLSQAELDNLPDKVTSAWRNGKTVFFVPLRDASARLELEAELRQLCSASEEQCGFPPPLASSLLFFRKLQHLVVHIEVDNECSVSFSMRQRQADQQYVALRREGTGSERQSDYDYWFFVSSSHTPDGDVKLAFLLPQENDQAQRQSRETDDATELPLAWVFTFLPVRCIGFRFAVQAPFHLTASRGDVHNNSAKNLRLRACIPAAFEEAVKKESTTCQAVGRQPYLAESSLMLLANDVVDVWWRPVREGILERISQNMDCIPIEPRGVARLAESLLRGPIGSKGRLLTEFLPSEVLWRSCGKHFVREDASTVSPEQLRQLGCEGFSIHTALQCLRHDWVKLIVENDFVFGAVDDIEETAASAEDFLRALYEFLLAELGKNDGSNEKEVTGDLLDDVMSVPLFPVCGGKCIPLNQGRLFRKFCPAMPKEWQEPLATQDTLLVLHPLLQNSSSPGVRTFLEKLHIEEPKLEDIAEQILHMYSLREDLMQYPIQHWSGSLACLREVWLRLLDDDYQDEDEDPYRDATDSEVILKKLWPELRNIVQLPNESGRLMPPRKLDCPTLFGIGCPLPADVRQQIAALVGMDLSGEVSSRVHSGVISEDFLSQGDRSTLTHLECEAFLCSIGVSPMPLLSKDTQVVSITLGRLFGSAKFWTALLASPKAAEYVRSRLRDASPQELEWLANLDVQEGVCIKDLFLKEVFTKHGGRFLSYIDVPRLYPHLSADSSAPPSGWARACVIEALSRLQVKVKRTRAALLEVWRVFANPRLPGIPTPRCTSVEVYADLFQAIMQKSDGKGDQGPGATSYIYVPGFVGDACFMLSQQCIWEAHAEPAFVQLAGKTALEPHYGRFGDAQQEFFLQVARVPKKMVCKHFRVALGALLEQVEAATALVAMGTSGDRAASAGAPEGGWAFSNPLELPNQVHSLVKCLYSEIAGFIAAEDQGPQNRSKPLPEEMVQGLESWIKSGLGGTRTFAEVVAWFVDEFGGTPENLHNTLERSSEFEVFTEGGLQRLRLRRGSTDLYGEKQTTHRCFAESRLIVVPEHMRRLPGGAPVAVIKRLYSGEAYWQVAPQLQRLQCANWALSQHYPPELKTFFLSVGVSPMLTVEELSRRLQEKAREDFQNRQVEAPAGESPQPAASDHAFHSDGYNLGDFIGGENDLNFGAELLNATSAGVDPLSMTEAYLQSTTAMLDPSAAAASAVDFLRQGQFPMMGDTLDLADDAHQAVMEQAVMEPQPSHSLHFVGEVRGLAVWGCTPRTSPLAGPILHRMEQCAAALRMVAERVYHFPASAVHLVDAGDGNEGHFCTGAFTARYRGALFIEVPKLDRSMRDLNEWAMTELAHQLAHSVEGHAHNLRFCKVLERIMAPNLRVPAS